MLFSTAICESLRRNVNPFLFDFYFIFSHTNHTNTLHLLRLTYEHLKRRHQREYERTSICCVVPRTTIDDKQHSYVIKCIILILMLRLKQKLKLFYELLKDSTNIELLLLDSQSGVGAPINHCDCILPQHQYFRIDCQKEGDLPAYPLQHPY